MELIFCIIFQLSRIQLTSIKYSIVTNYNDDDPNVCINSCGTAAAAATSSCTRADATANSSSTTAADTSSTALPTHSTNIVHTNTRMTIFIKANLKKSDRQTNIHKYGVSGQKI